MVKAKQLNSGNWRCQVYDYTDETGKKHYKSFTAPSQREAEYAALTYQMQREHSHTHMTLGEAYDEYVRIKHNILSPSTRRGYVSARRNHFQNLMDLDIGDITEEMVQRTIDLMAIKYSAKTIHNQYGILVPVLKMFRREFHMDISLPMVRTPDTYVPSTEEVQRLYDMADEPLKVPIILASQASLRCSEICAVKLQSFTDKGVKVTEAVVMDENNVYITKLPKTDKSRRFSPMSSEAISICKNWSHFGITPRNLEKRFFKLCEKAKVPTTLHALRHYYASKSHMEGIPDLVIMKYGGWKTVATLHRIYLHALKEYDTENEKKVINAVGVLKL